MKILFLTLLMLSTFGSSFSTNGLNDSYSLYNSAAPSRNDILNLCNYYENTVVCMDRIANAESLQMMNSYAQQMSGAFAQMYAFSASLNYPSFSEAILLAKKEADALMKCKTPQAARPHAKTAFGYINGMSGYISKLRKQYNIKPHNVELLRKYKLL